MEIPKEFHVGFKIYANGKNLSGKLIPDSVSFHYGTIVSEDESFWYVHRTFIDDTDDPVFFVKSDMEEKYVEEKFIILREELNESNADPSHTD